MELSLEKIDEIIQRTGCTYKDAKRALEQSNGDVLEAIILLEEEGNTGDLKERFIKKLKNIVDDGVISQIVVSKNGRTIVDIPVVGGLATSIVFPVQTLALFILAISTKCDVNIVKRDGTEFKFTDVTLSKINEILDYFESRSNVKKANDFYPGMDTDSEYPIYESQEHNRNEDYSQPDHINELICHNSDITLTKKI